MNPYILKEPLVTEKSMELANSQNTYTFLVSLEANKHQIKQAVEELYDVAVMNINTVTQPAQVKRTGQKRLSTIVPKRKKALVKIKEGQTIELFDVSE